LRYEPGALAIRVADDGGCGDGKGDAGQPPRPAAANADALPAGGGHGLTGMAERAAALGGEGTAGPRAQGGFEVVARLPFAAGGAAGACPAVPPATTPRSLPR